MANENQPTVQLNANTSKISNTFAHFKILAELGRGGMGCVYKAFDTKLERTVALKVLISQSQVNMKQLDRFLIEARATAKLIHPNIVRVYEIGNEKGIAFFTMDCIEGVSLKEVIKSKKLTLRKGLILMKKVSEAMYYAHQNGIIHRDLKPANVMVDEKGEPYVMDFGLAKTLNSDKKLTKTGTIMGTLFYMPPEQAEGQHREIDQRSDIYSLGAMIYEIITGRVPHYSNVTLTLLKKITQEPIQIPSTLVKNRLSKDLDYICLKALAKKKINRYENANELAQDLESFIQGKPIGATGQRWTKTHIISIVSIVALIAAILVLNTKKTLDNKIAKKASKSKIVKKASKSKMAKKAPGKMPEGWEPGDWKACWNPNGGFIDFTCKTWEKFSHKQRLAHAESYQHWYAQHKKLDLKKKFKINGAKFRMRLIPPGKFLMGSPESEKERRNNEKQHDVLISKAFYLSTTEVTEQQWYKITGERPWADEYGVKKKSRRAASHISWDDIKSKFLPKLSGKFALPTEAQWEYACRAGTLARFYWGDDSKHKKIGSYAWYKEKRGKSVYEVKLKLPNAWGLYDMSGNVYEWCEDYCKKKGVMTNTYVNGRVDPVCKEGSQRVIRGGYWNWDPKTCRSAFRLGEALGWKPSYVGFRLCITSQDYPKKD